MYNTSKRRRTWSAALISVLVVWHCESFQQHPMRQQQRQSQSSFLVASHINNNNNNNKKRVASSTAMFATDKKSRGRKSGNQSTNTTTTTTIATLPSKKKQRNQTKQNIAAVAAKNNNNNSPPRRTTTELNFETILNHDILTAQEEKALGRKIRRAVEVKSLLDQIVEENRQNLLEQQQQEELSYEDEIEDLLLYRQQQQDYDEFLVVKDQDTHNHHDHEDEDDHLEGLSVFDLKQQNTLMEFEKRTMAINHYNDHYNDDGDNDNNDHDDEDFQIHSLISENDIVEKLGVEGGREELTRILLDGALAREKMISSNIRLVVSIAKKWCLRSNFGDSNGGATRSSLYAGSWSRPSLDEAVQEGIFGLATAADRFEPERNLKFATYATHWITNSVRSCFNRAKTNGLRVPVNFHVYRQKYQTIVRKHYESHGSSLPLEEAAKELNLTPARLNFILQSTQSSKSLDAPLSSGNAPGQAGKAGAQDLSTDGGLSLIHTLPSDEAALEDQIEVSLLRQCLENAMATELSPHERDVLRLRHGLDDGVSRSVREVTEICGGTLRASDIRQAELRAFRKLRSPFSVHTVQLYQFLDFVGADLQTIKTKR